MKNVISAAGVILLNQNNHNSGFNVLLLKRNPKLKVHGGNWVFPGGKFDAEDYRILNISPSEIDIRNPPVLPQNKFLQVAQQAALREMQEEAGIILEKQSLEYHSRWLTPRALSKRFDTCFFISETTNNNVIVDGSEIIDFQWMTPIESLALQKEGKIASHYRPKLITINNGLCSLYEEDVGYEDEDYFAEGKHHRLNIVSGSFEYICD